MNSTFLMKEFCIRAGKTLTANIYSSPFNRQALGIELSGGKVLTLLYFQCACILVLSSIWQRHIVFLFMVNLEVKKKKLIENIK